MLTLDPESQGSTISGIQLVIMIFIAQLPSLSSFRHLDIIGILLGRKTQVVLIMYLT